MGKLKKKESPTSVQLVLGQNNKIGKNMDDDNKI